MEGTVLEMWKETTGNGLLLIGRIGRTKEVWRCTRAHRPAAALFSVNAQWASAAATVLIQHKAVEKENSCATRTWSHVCTHPDKHTQTCTFIIAQQDSSQRSSQECFSNYILHFTLEFLTVYRSLDSYHCIILIKNCTAFGSFGRGAWCTSGFTLARLLWCCLQSQAGIFFCEFL